MHPQAVDFAMPAVVFAISWILIGFLGSMLGYRHSAAAGFALGALVAGVWVIVLA